VRTRHDILDAAARAFARSGFVDATMQDIAREAGYTAASLYTYFRSKQEIFEGLVDLLTEEFLATFDERLPLGLTFAQQLEILLRRQLELADRRRDAFTVFLTVHSSPQLFNAAYGAQPARGRKKAPGTGMDLYDLRLTEWIREVGQSTDIGPHDPADLACSFVGIAHAFFLRGLRGSSGDRLADRTRLIVDLFLNGAMGGSAGDSTSGAR
jgi:AcrR family transcriptional regulator